MGWTTDKEKVLPTDAISRIPQDSAELMDYFAQHLRVALDCCATARKNTPFKPNGHGVVVSPREAVTLLLKNNVYSRYPNSRHVLLAFDTSEKIHEMRLQQKRYMPPSKAPRASDAEVVAMTADFIPCSYELMWANPRGKQKLYDIMGAILVELISESVDTSYTTFYLDLSTGTRLVIAGKLCQPHESDPVTEWKSHNFGEADQKVCWWVDTFSGDHPVMISTIDADIIPQILCSRNVNCHIHLWVVYQHKLTGVMKRSKPKIDASAYAPWHEFIDMSIFKMETREKRLNRTMWYLCIGTCDYNEGLRPNGYASDKLITLLPKLLEERPAIRLDEPKLEITWNPRRVYDILIKHIPKRSARAHREFSEGVLAAELKRIICTILLFMCFNPNRTRGGPTLIPPPVVPPKNATPPPIDTFQRLRICNLD